MSELTQDDIYAILGAANDRLNPTINEFALRIILEEIDKRNDNPVESMTWEDYEKARVEYLREHSGAMLAGNALYNMFKDGKFK